ncbi:MAG: bifunctional homocysteine S-methyltransferase/methylenetetrahydrofolate reductase, partial [Firmicutes bacterium]|nr:bifunctional homocysteine S-methyltransferase/methylenetetrahydrofolate reductase [Bacillota bacterium]
NYRNACFMDSEISGIKVDKRILELYKDKTAEEGRALAVKTSVAIAREIKDYCDGYYLMTPFGKTDLMCEIIDEIRKIEAE